jgi:hypothetical protein
MQLPRLAASLIVLFAAASGVRAAEPSYPFVGSWVRSDRSCSASATRERIYSARDVVSNRSRCTIRRIASGSGGYQLFERCERPNEKPFNVSEIIRMTGPDSMVLTRQTARLKLSRSLHFTRCPTPPSSPTKQPAR